MLARIRASYLLAACLGDTSRDRRQGVYDFTLRLKEAGYELFEYRDVVVNNVVTDKLVSLHQVK